MEEKQHCAGFARLDMTPPLGVDIPGGWNKKVGEGILDPLYVNAIAFGDGGKTAVILVMDLLGIYGPMMQWKDSLTRDMGMDPDSLLLCCTHRQSPRGRRLRILQHALCKGHSRAACRHSGQAAGFPVRRKDSIMYQIHKVRAHPVIDFAAEELKKYLRMMMPESGNVSIAYAPEARDGFRLGLLENFGLPFPVITQMFNPQFGT